MSVAALAIACAALVGVDPPVDRALGYLAREVPRWSVENRCYSCHHNGDAARALHAVARAGLPVPPLALADTTAWLSRPEAWDNNGGDGPFSDKRLARLQFAATLASAAMVDRGPLQRAARRLAEDQADDGSWQVDPTDAIGSPTTLGRPLATHLARETLRAADLAAHRPAIDRAGAWLAARPLRTTLDASAALLADVGVDGAPISHLLKSQGEAGGWGPHPGTPPEPFDTAIAVLALARVVDRPGVRDAIRRARDHLVAAQLPDGSWPETTRPAGSESFAQRLSTAGWALQALLAARDATLPEADR